jgi:hypothetical protein
VYARLPGRKVLSFGGYNAANDRGYWTAAKLSAINNAFNTGLISTDKYGAILYDIEYGDTGLLSAFLQSFAIAKAMGFQVIVCVSGPAPFAFADLYTLAKGFVISDDVDIISPMLYASGYESVNDYYGDWAAGGWKGVVKPRIVVSITGYAHRNGGYADAQKWFLTNLNIATNGFITWEE